MLVTGFACGLHVRMASASAPLDKIQESIYLSSSLNSEVDRITQVEMGADDTDISGPAKQHVCHCSADQDGT